MSCSGLDVPRRTELTPSFLRHHAVDSKKQEFVDVLDLTTNITELLALSLLFLDAPDNINIPRRIRVFV